MLAVSSLALYAQSASSVRNAEKIARALYLIETCYLDTVDVDKAIDRMLDRLMQDLDPHSTYMPKESVEALNEPLDGTFEGVGIEYAIISDTLTVQAVVAGGPAEAVGLRAGDKIVAVGGETKFVCVDGPEFDGHQVDFDQMMSRLGAFKAQERIADEHCRFHAEAVAKGLKE